ncbi:Maf family protein [Candidatus Dependentiae bacterium]|nr:Maf family protein [Candidatus Dependentiae bacterium]
MQQHQPLYLASQSRMRKHLLSLSKIFFIELPQSADESACDWTLPAAEVVGAIARSKMDYATVPTSHTTKCAYVLTADTLCVDTKGKVHGKPANEQEARAMLALWRLGCTVITGFCLDKKINHNDIWLTEERIEQSVSSTINMSIPDEWIAYYFENTPSFHVAGGMAIEEYGCQFVHSINGSYSNILGLPLFEVREALSKLNFFSASLAS